MDGGVKKKNLIKKLTEYHGETQFAWPIAECRKKVNELVEIINILMKQNDLYFEYADKIFKCGGGGRIIDGKCHVSEYDCMKYSKCKHYVRDEQEKWNWLGK